MSPNTQLVPVEGTVEPGDTEKLVESMMPYFPDDSRKSKYLGYRATGFAIREAVHLTGITERTLRRWRDADPEFRRLDLEAVGELRAQLGDHYIAHEYRRNMRLVLQKDYDVLSQSVDGGKLSDQDAAYLTKLRGFYTPQQLETLQKLIGESVGEKFDWTEFVLKLRNSRGELELSARKGDA